MSQLSLLEQCFAAPEKPTLGFKPVPSEISLVPVQRFYFRVEQGDRAFTYQVIQLTELEARMLLPKVAKLDWRLNEECIPHGLSEIHDWIEAALGGTV